MHLASVRDTIANLNMSLRSIKHKRYIKLFRELFSKGLFRKYVHGRRKIDTWGYSQYVNQLTAMLPRNMNSPNFLFIGSIL
jgi:hypothetical protein